MASGNHRERKDEMMKGREKSDGRMVPEGLRKLAPTAARRGGKATTASQQEEPLEMTSGTADSLQRDVAGADGDPSQSAPRAVPKPESTYKNARPAMTMEEVCSRGNLIEAFEKVAANKGAPGPDKQTIAEVRQQLDDMVPHMQRSLLDGTYRPGDIRRVWIPKPGGGEPRGLGIPDVVDRIVQQAVHQVLSPNYEPTFHRCSHGFRPGRSCHTAIDQAKEYLEEGYEWTVDLDLSKFFDRVHHQRLIARLELRIKDTRIIRLIRRMLKANVVMPDGVVMSTETGTPQGGPLSPLLSNIVLDELDWELDQRGHRFVRYADDCNIYVRSQRAGKRVMESIVRFIQKRLQLVVNTDKSAVDRPHRRHFLGFRLQALPWKDDVEVMLSKRSLDRIAERIRELTPRNWGQSLRDCIRRLNRYLRGWFAFFRVCTEPEVKTLARLDAHIRRRLRAIVLKQWKRKRTIAHRLIKLGVKSRTAWRTLYDQTSSWWALSRSPAVHRGLDNAYFAKLHLFSLRAAWDEFQNVVNAPRQLKLPGV